MDFFEKKKLDFRSLTSIGVGKSAPTPRHWLFAVVNLLIGAVLAAGGTKLVALGGSAYYLVCGAVLIASATFMVMGSKWGWRLYALMLLGTFAWALDEVGWNGWSLMPRLLGPAILGLWLLLPWLARSIGWRPVAALGLIVAALCGGTVWALDADRLVDGKAGYGPASPNNVAGRDWANFAADPAGTHFSRLDAITPANVGALKSAWTYHTGDLPGASERQTAWTFESAPIKIDNTLYVCTAHYQVHAIDADTGKRVWMFDPHARLDWVPLRACRGVAFYRAPQAPPGAECVARILVATGDRRLIALDALTGAACKGFGHDGAVDLSDGIGPIRPGYLITTSPPVIVKGLAVLGAQVMDGAELGEPSGVIRAYDAMTGKLAWAWDMGAPDQIGAPPPGAIYTRGTPNAWPPLSADPALGLVFVPLGNATPDTFGAHRSAASEKYTDALVALDVHDGRPRWSYQTVHHDLWDQDLPAQPTLTDFPTPQGLVPAVIQATKRGELFVLDRRTGVPLAAVEERKVPTDAAAGDFASPTQPYAIGMPSLIGSDLTEAGMWGITPVDQLWCRIAFRRLHYEGQFTPPSVQGSIVYPGSAGVVSWGGVAVDETRRILVVNTTLSPFVSRLIPRAQADRLGFSTPPNAVAGPQAAGGADGLAAPGAEAAMPQLGTPYAAQIQPFLSPLGAPCTSPPWGKLVAIDLQTRKILWQRPLGTGRDTGPLGLRTGPPLTMGMANTGGAALTATGLIFIAAAQDQYLRAFDIRDGSEMWRARLPGGGQAGAITYQSTRSGKQYVAISAGGHGGLNTRTGDAVLAYAIP